MSEWKKVLIKDLGRTVTGHTPPTKEKKYFGDFMPFVKPTDISKDEKYTYHPEQYYSREAAEKYKNSLIPKGATCVVCIGTIGEKMTMAHCDLFTNQSINSIIPSDEYDPDFVYYLLKYNLGKVKSLNKGTASGREFVSKSTFLDMPVMVCEDKGEQIRIGSVLSRYDSLIENYQQQVKLLEEAAQRLYKEWFVDLHFPGYENTKIVDGVPEGWGKKKLIELADVQYGYAFNGSLFNNKREGMPILRIRDIPDGYSEDYTTEKTEKKYIVHNGDIVVGMDGIFHINTWSGNKAYLVQRACSIRPKSEGIKGFLFQAIKEPIKYFEKTLVGATVAHLGKKHIDSIELLVPNGKGLYSPFTVLNEIRQNYLNQILLLTEARDRLLPKLMSGEIKV